MMIAMVFMKVEFGPMGVHETNALKGDIYTTAGRPYANAGGWIESESPWKSDRSSDPLTSVL